MEIKRGDIFWVEIPDSQTVGSEQKGKRPYIIVSRTSINKMGRTVVGVPMSTKTKKQSAYRIVLPAAEIIKDVTCTSNFVDSVALTDHVRVLDQERLIKPREAHLSDSAIIALELGLSFLLQID